MFLLHSLYFSVPEEVGLNSTHYLIMKIHNRRELQQIAINHSADIDYKDFLKVYKDFFKGLQKLYKRSPSFLTINTLLLSSAPLISSFLVLLRFFLIKVTINEQVKILDNKN